MLYLNLEYSEFNRTFYVEKRISFGLIEQRDYYVSWGGAEFLIIFQGSAMLTGDLLKESLNKLITLKY